MENMGGLSRFARLEVFGAGRALFGFPTTSIARGAIHPFELNRFF
jgi:hypothetical protein